MKTIQIYDKPMCCSTGICGPQVDPVLPRFAADLAWLKDQGVAVERFNLSQQPREFVNHTDVRDAIREGHEKVLPMIRVNNQIVCKGIYPTREQLAQLCGVSPATSLAMKETTGGSCGSTGCC